MWGLTLAQMRRSAGRLTAAAVAIAIGTAFVAATLLAGDVMRRISSDSITASFGSADLVAVSPDPLTDRMVEDVRAQPGVSAADPQVLVPSVELSAGDRAITQAFIPVTTTAAFDTQHVTAGALPTADGGITLPERAAERLHVAVGGQVTVSYYRWQDDASPEPGTTSSSVVLAQDTVTVTGLTTDPRSAWAEYGGAAQATTADTLLWSGWSEDTATPTLADADTRQLKIAVTGGADLAAVQQSVARVLDAAATSDVGTLVLTRDAIAERTLSGDDTGPITIVILSFAAVALLVAGLVIANTFQVLVAQRTRTLALLRCVGAVRSQVRRSVLLEATLLGAAASLAGLVLGTGLVQAALWVMQRADLPFPVPSAVHPTLAAVVVPLLVGVVVTVLAALSPARAATRVAPIAALRPADGPDMSSRAGRVRLVLGLLMVLGGGAALAGGVALASAGQLLGGVGIAILGGAGSFVGLLVTAVLWMPKVVAAAGRVVGRAGMPARLAAANTGRNPARTAATSTALLIGVTLVAMMSTGAVTARSTLDGELDSRYPVDLQVSAGRTVGSDGGSTTQALPAGTLDRLAAVPGVTSVVPVTSGLLHLGTVGGDVDVTVSVQGVTATDAAAVLRDADVAAAIGDGVLALPDAYARSLGLEDGQTVRAALGDEATGCVADGSATEDLRVAVTRLPDWTAVVTPATLGTLGSTAATGGAATADTADTVWLRLAEVNDSGTVVQDVQDATEDQALDITGAAMERAMYQRAIDTVLAVVIGLLAVAVVIALVGVTNTL